MNTIKLKLNSNRGATLIFAMVALTIAVIVCAVVIYAAESNAGRIRSAQAAEQAHLSLNSAASVVRDQIAGNTIRVNNSYSTLNKVTNNGSTTVTTVVKKSDGMSVVYEDKDRNNAVHTLANANYVVVPDAEGFWQFEEGETLTHIQKDLLFQWVIEAVTNQSTLTKDSCERNNMQITATDMPTVNFSLHMVPGKTSDLVGDAIESSEAQKFYLTAVFKTDSNAETITMSFMATVRQSTTSVRISPYKEDGGNTTVDGVRTVESYEISWLDENIVVNVAGSQGG